MRSAIERSPTIAGAAAAAAAATGVAALATGAWIAAGFSAATVALLAAFAVPSRRPRATTTDGAYSALVRKMAEQAEAGRKLVIYERQTGLYAYWYLSLRCEEECDRSARYERTLTLLTIEPSAGSNAQAVQGQIGEWLRTRLRPVDLAAYAGNARYIALLPETGAQGADVVTGRLRRDVADIDVGVAVFPQDGVTFEKLYGGACARLAAPAQEAA